MSRLRVYISGPITKGDRVTNFARACEVHELLLRRGYAPLNPMLSMMHPSAWTIEHDVWVRADLPWVECAQAVYRLPGESTGADIECEHARLCNIPVLYSFDELERWRENHERAKF